MTPMPLPPEFLPVPGSRIRVTRAWPVPDKDRLGIECEQDGQRRAGFYDHAGAQLQPVGIDRRLPGLEPVASSGTVVSHRPGKRAVVRDGTSYIKVVRPGRAAAILEGIRRAGAFTASFRTPEVLAQDDSTVTFAALQGTSLHDPSQFTAAHWRRAWTEVLDAWVHAVLPAQPALTTPPGGDRGPAAEAVIPQHTAHDEAKVLHRWARLVTPYLDRSEPLERLAQEVAAQLQQLPEAPVRPAHRDLHDKQLLWSPQAGPGLLDVDTACRADAALDLGNLRAHAHLRALQGGWGPQEAQTVITAVDAAASRLEVPARPLAVYERGAILRLGCVYAVRPGSGKVAAQLREVAAQPGFR